MKLNKKHLVISSKSLTLPLSYCDRVPRVGPLRPLPNQTFGFVFTGRRITFNREIVSPYQRALEVLLPSRDLD